MKHYSRFILCSGLFTLLLLTNTALSQSNSLDGPAFSAKPAEILQAASGVTTDKTYDATVLLDEREVRVDDAGNVHYRWHYMYRVDSSNGVSTWGNTNVMWQPWHQSKPTIKARVVNLDGSTHELDPATLSDSPARENTPDTYGDQRMYRGPLPAVQVGSVVEIEIRLDDERPALEGAGTLVRIYPGRRVPSERLRVVVQVPKALHLRYKAYLLPEIKVSSKELENSTQYVFENGKMAAIEKVEPDLPSDTPGYPILEVTTAESWEQVASAYLRVAEPQIQMEEVKQIVAGTVSAKDSREQKIVKLTARLHKEVRYTGVEFGQSRLVPQTAAEVFKRKYGDCKDKAATLVAMLRAASIPAYLALLDADGGFDASPDSPGMDAFDHAIVYVPGKPDVWIDATDEFSAPGQLPLQDQGRHALVIREKTNGLTNTPTASPMDNLLVENREFYLSENGPARIVEWSEAHGQIDRSYRSYYGVKQDQKAIQKSLDEYAKTVYLAEEPVKFELSDGYDLTTPFKFRVEVPKGRRGSTGLSDAAVAIALGGMANRLPEFFRKDDEDSGKKKNGQAREEKADPPRTADYVLAIPYVTEWRYKIVPPPGFKVRSLRNDKTDEMGPARLTQTYKTDKDGVLYATFRFDTVKSRMTVAEAEALKKSVLELQRSNYILLAFDQVGYSLLSEGKTSEAISAFNSLMKLHPTEALHHVQLAQALLDAGIAEAARNEAREAVKLEPNSALAHKTLAWMLEHDLVGRRFQKGFDFPGALAEFKRAIEIDPDDDTCRTDYAILLEHNANGVRYAADANLAESVVQYEELKKRGSTWESLDNNLLYAELFSHQYKKIEEAVPKLEGTNARLGLLLASIAAQRGSEPALARSLEVTSNEDSRMEVIQNAGSLLLELNLYPQAADMLAKVNTGNASLEILDVIRKTKPYTELKVEGNDPAAQLKRLLIASIGPQEPNKELISQILPVPVGKTEKRKEDPRLQDLKLLNRGVRNMVGTEIPTEARGDILLSNMKIYSEGDDNSGYRLMLESLGVNGLAFYAVKTPDGYRFVSPSEQGQTIARIAREKVRAGDLKSARMWLDWQREETNADQPDDPLGGSIFARFWKKGQNGDREAIEVAIAALLADSAEDEDALKVLKSAYENAKTEQEKVNLDLAALREYIRMENFGAALEPAERLFKAQPDSHLAFRFYYYTLAETKKYDAAEKIINDRIKLDSRDLDTFEFISDVSDRKGDFKRSLSLLAPVLQMPKPTPSLLNKYAWTALFVNPMPPDAVEAAQRANRLSDNKNFSIIHTLACVYAEIGRTGEAQKLLIQAMDADNMEEPNDAIWYIVGRIAEQYGRPAEARSAYLRMEKPEGTADSPTATYSLAKKRLEGLPKAE